MILYHRTEAARADSIRETGFKDMSPPGWKERDACQWFCDERGVHLDAGPAVLVVDVPSAVLAECHWKECVKRDGDVGRDYCIPNEIATRYLIPE